MSKLNVFVDDIFTGANTDSEAQSLKPDLIRLIQGAGYKLRKWSSNLLELLSDMPLDYCEEPRQFDNHNQKRFIKVLDI